MEVSDTANILDVAALSGERRFSATPFVFRDVRTISRREWLYGRAAIRKEITTTIAPGGLGKTALSLVEAAAMATGRNLLGIPVEEPLRVWVWNGEEPFEEMERRIGAIRAFYDLADEEFGDRLFVDVGHDMPLVLAEQRQSVRVCTPVVEALVDELVRRSIDVMVVDPFVSTHHVNENDNSAIQQAATAWKDVAVGANCAIMLVHHTRKLNGQEANIDSSRGADALPSKARIVRALNPMSAKDASLFGISGDEQKIIFWYDPANGKGNMSSRASSRQWFKSVSVPLYNLPRGNLDVGDEVGVVTAWQPPNVVTHELCEERVEAFKHRLDERQWFGRPQSKNRPDWVGVLIAEVFNIATTESTWKIEAQALFRQLLNDGHVAVVNGHNPETRKPVKIVRPVNVIVPIDETLH